MATWPSCNYWDANCLLEDFWERALSLIKGEMSVKRVCFSFHPGMSPSLLLVGKLWLWDYEGKAKSLKDISTGYNYKAAVITWNWLFSYDLSISVGFLLQADKCFPAEREQDKLIVSTIWGLCSHSQTQGVYWLTVMGWGWRRVIYPNENKRAAIKRKQEMDLRQK